MFDSARFETWVTSWSDRMSVESLSSRAQLLFVIFLWLLPVTIATQIKEGTILLETAGAPPILPGEKVTTTDAETASTFLMLSSGVGGADVPAPSYVDGPRVDTKAWVGHCHPQLFDQQDAEAMCSSDATCTIIINSGCDNASWRYCFDGAIDLSAGGDTESCTRVHEAKRASGQLIPDVTAGDIVSSVGLGLTPYLTGCVDGPRVDEDAWMLHCYPDLLTLKETAGKCFDDEECTVLHDIGCDGAGWRQCFSTIDLIQAAGASQNACTKLCKVEVCVDSEYGATGNPAPSYRREYSSCELFETSPGLCSWSHYYDDSDFTARNMCCACGGGTREHAPTRSVDHVDSRRMTAGPPPAPPTGTVLQLLLWEGVAVRSGKGYLNASIH